MISLSTPTAPPCLPPFGQQHPLPAFDALGFQACKRQIRSRLLTNQRHQCAYCERAIADVENSSHLDHMIPQIVAPNSVFDIGNLVASCQDNQTCGHKHGERPVPNDLNPYLSVDLHLAFHCGSDGELDTGPKPLPPASEDFAFTQLALNAPGLKSARETVLRSVRQHSIALGTKARKRLKNLPDPGVGFRSLYHQELEKFGYPAP